MVARVQLIDITKGYIPLIDRSYGRVLLGTSEEDRGEKPLPVIITSGRNFIPTYNGWASVTMGQSSGHIPPLLHNPSTEVATYIQEIIQYASVDTLLVTIALTNRGIYLKDPNTGTWTSYAPSYNPSGSLMPWSYCVVDDVLYMSTGANGRIFTLNNNMFDWFSPTFVTSFSGVFKAGTRIGVWDTSNTVFWSSAEDPTDFEPSLTTLAGYARFEGVTGNIKTILSHGEGFIIYTDKSIIGSRFLPNSDLLWDAQILLATTGIPVSRCVCSGFKDTEHYVWTHQGLYKIQMYAYDGTTNPVVPVHTEIQDYLQKASVVYPVFVSERHLALCMSVPTPGF